MEITDVKLSDNLKKAVVAKKIRDNILMEIEKTPIFAHKDKEQRNVSEQENGRRALFDDATFDRLGVTREVESEELER